jgi:parallel beta helix pectate lyase-like protein
VSTIGPNSVSKSVICFELSIVVKHCSQVNFGFGVTTPSFVQVAYKAHGVGNIVIENNEIHDNRQYGLDPHTGTHDMVIRNNTVHDNGSIGIICSLNCYNITNYHSSKSTNASINVI